MAVYIAIVNSIVHIVMYTYYFFSSFENKKILNVTKRVKPAITFLQLAQFAVIIAHCVIAILPDCNASWFFHLQLVNFIVLVFLFGNFFIQSYCKTENRDEKGNYQMTQT